MVSHCLPHQWHFKSDTWRNRTENPCVVSLRATTPLHHFEQNYRRLFKKIINNGTKELGKGWNECLVGRDYEKWLVHEGSHSVRHAKDDFC